jgi:glycosyltransferase involved in cell wall biosynthesis
MLLSITLLSYNDNELLIHTMKELLNNTNFDGIDFEVQLLVQCCSKAYIMSIEALCKSYKQYKIILHTEERNLGIGGGGNFLYNVTKNSKYVLHIEDDWILYQADSNWLNACIQRLENNESLSTVVLRRYGTEKEKFDYGWSRHIPYVCHKNKENFNYQNKLGETEIEFVNEGSTFKNHNFTPIKNFLFTFNPVIRRNIDYQKCNVYPLPEFEDGDGLVSQFENQKKIHTNEKWGWCEALTMEKTIDLNSEMYENGIFVHFDDWVDVLKADGKGPFKNDLSNLINLNCHYPVLVIHTDNIVRNTTKYKHDFLRFIHSVWVNDRTEDEIGDRIKEIERILIDYKPRCIVTVGDINKVGYILAKYFDFENRKRWFHIDKDETLDINIVEKCCFNAFDHPGEIASPLISVITPTYESKHRILRPYTSLLSQTYRNWEWIIIDDSKTDETWKKLTELADTDHRIKIYRRQKNNGSIGDNKRFCGKVANGKFIFEYDHDDDILPQCFERLIQASKKYPDAGFFYSDCVEAFEDTYQAFRYGDYFGLGFGSYYRQWWNNDWHYVYKTHRMNPHTFRHIVGVPNHFRCWTKECYFDCNGHNPDLQVADDYDLILRSMFKYRWVHIPEHLYVQYRNNGGDNFTVHRNALIQYLVNKLRWTHEESIHKRLEELGVKDEVYHKNPQHDLDYEVNTFEYPIIDYVYKHEDRDPNNPLISIVIPTYNRPKHLRKALDSIFQQTYQNFEILVVGDKCPSLENFVKSYEKAKDKRFKFFNLPKNYGPGGAVPRNYAIKMMCCSEWIAYLDDDNTWTPNHLETMVENIRKNPEAKMIVNSMYIDGKVLEFDDMRKGRIDTSAVCHRFELCVRHGLWRDRNEDGYAHDFQFFNRFRDENIVWTLVPTLNYNTEFNGQSWEQLIQF